MRQLRPYQEQAAEFLTSHKKGILLLDMGLGKTAVSCKAASNLGCRLWLVIARANAHSVWRDDAKQWIEQFTGKTVYVKIMDEGPAVRPYEWAKLTRPPTVFMTIVVVVEPEIFLRDFVVRTKRSGTKKGYNFKINPAIKFAPDVVIVDDYHKRFRSHKAQSYHALKTFLTDRKTPHFFALTGTPGNRPMDFWTMLNLINPTYFSSYWNFVEAFHTVIDGFWGKEILEPRNLPEWRNILNRYAFTVTKVDVASQLPPKQRTLIPVQLDKDQKRLYQELERELLAELPEDELIVAPNTMTKILRLRQLLTCPRIFHSDLSLGSAFNHFLDLMEDEDEQTRHTVLFAPFTGCFPHFRDALLTKGFPFVGTLRGGLSTAERDRCINEYRRTRGIMLCSIEYAEAFSLEPATTGYFIGSTWSPDTNRQAEDRIHRLTTKNPINIYYYSYEQTIDKEIQARVNLKQEYLNVTQLRTLLHR